MGNAIINVANVAEYSLGEANGYLDYSDDNFFSDKFVVDNGSYEFDVELARNIIPDQCIEPFESRPLENTVAAKFQTFQRALFFDENGSMLFGTKTSFLGCKRKKHDGILDCDWNNMFDDIVEICSVIDHAHSLGISHRNCADELQLSPELFGDDGTLMSLQDDNKWCTAYYDEDDEYKNGIVTLSDMHIVNNCDEADFFSFFSGETVIKNVPYCTAGDDCSVDDFFYMLNLQAESYSQHLSERFGTSIDCIEMKFIPQDATKVKSKKKGKKDKKDKKKKDKKKEKKRNIR